MVFKVVPSLAMGGLLLSSACATVVRGSNVEFEVYTDPPGAQVATNLKTNKTKRIELRARRKGKDVPDGFVPIYHGCDETPCAFEVSRRSEFEVVVTKDGYHPATVQITSGFGRGGTGQSLGGAAITATGAYIVSYSVYSYAITAGTLGLASSGAVAAGAGSAAATGAAGIGIIFLGVDVISGAMLDVRPNPLVLVLIPEHQELPDGPIAMIESREELETLLQERQ